MIVRRFCPFGLVLAGLILGALVPTVMVAAAEPDSTDEFLHQNQVGLRVGVWSNQGDLPPARGEFTSGAVNTGEFKSNIQGSSAYLEAFFSYRLLPWSMIELVIDLR